MIDNTTAPTLPELLGTQAGFGTRDFYGNNAAGATADLRGFGAAASQNTLILLDGRPLNDIDMSGVQWSAVPLSQIDRVEIVRGSGAVLYGGGASGGVVNIITRQPQPGDAQAFVGARAGSYDTYELQVGASKFFERFGIRAFGSDLRSQGYRDNNRNEQQAGQAELRWLHDGGELRLTALADRQELRLPGARTVDSGTGLDQLATDRRGTSTPNDFSSRDGNQVALDASHRIGFTEAAVGLTYRDKRQKSYFDFGGFPDYRDIDLKVMGITPRLKVDAPILGQENTFVTGMDFYDWDYRLDLSGGPALASQPIHRVTGTQRTVAAYVQDSMALVTNTTLSAGYRIEQFEMNVDDAFDPAAPNPGFSPGGSGSGRQREKTHAWELGLRQRLSETWALMVRTGTSYRFASIDEIYETGALFQQEFQFLRPQQNRSKEIAAEYRTAKVNGRAALFRIDVEDEIRLDPYSTGRGNTNLPALRRDGLELSGGWTVSPKLTVTGAYTYIDARFQEGTLPGGGSSIASNVPLAGKRVPLVPRHRAAVTVSWLVANDTRLNLTQTYVSDQVMENDEVNTFRRVPEYMLTDVNLVHTTGPWRFTAAVNNLFDENYYNYAIRSQFAPTRFNAYPLPGRNANIAVTYTFQ